MNQQVILKVQRDSFCSPLELWKAEDGIPKRGGPLPISGPHFISWDLSHVNDAKIKPLSPQGVKSILESIQYQ